MALLEDLADSLAADVMQAMAELQNDRLYLDVSKVLGTSSPSMQEAFLTSIRLRMAAARGRTFFDETVRAAKQGLVPPPAPPDPDKGGGH